VLKIHKASGDGDDRQNHWFVKMARFWNRQLQAVAPRRASDSMRWQAGSSDRWEWTFGIGSMRHGCGRMLMEQWPARPADHDR